MASLDEEERRLALKQTKLTIETAQRLGAKAVVLHTGRVEIPDRTKDLIDLFNRGQKDSPEFRDLKSGVIKVRSEKIKPFLENALKSLEELNLEALKKNVLLGVETRFYYREIPNLEEISRILERFNGSQIRYWHDTGHAQVMENLGFVPQRDYLDSYERRMIGVHLHDIANCRDHLAPLKGELDFASFKPFLKKETLKVIEAHHPATADDLKKSKAFLEKIFHGIA